MQRSNKKWWHDWVRPQRLIPLVTVIGAFVALLLAGLGILTVSIPEGVVLSLLGLLAIDALSERMGILERIQHRLDEVIKDRESLSERMGILERIQHSLDEVIEDRESHPRISWEPDALRETSLENLLLEAAELFVSGGSLIALLSRQREHIQHWLRQTRDAKLLLILEDPEAARRGKTPVWSSDIDQSRETYAQDIESSLKIIAGLKEEYPGKIEARLTDQVPSLTIMIIDRNRAQVCLNLYMGGPPNRPVFELSKTKHPEWFRLFEERYCVRLWKQSVPLA